VDAGSLDRRVGQVEDVQVRHLQHGLEPEPESSRWRRRGSARSPRGRPVRDPCYRSTFVFEQSTRIPGPGRRRRARLDAFLSSLGTCFCCEVIAFLNSGRIVDNGQSCQIQPGSPRRLLVPRPVWWLAWCSLGSGVPRHSQVTGPSRPEPQVCHSTRLVQQIYFQYRSHRTMPNNPH